MRNRRWLRFAAFALVGLVLLGLLGYAAGGSGGGPATTSPPNAAEGAADAPDEVMASIDRALGRETGVPVAQAANGAAPALPAVAPPAPAKDVAAGRATTASSAGKTVEAPAGGPGAAPNAAPAANLDDRKIVQTATLKLQVKDVGPSFNEVGRIAGGAGGFVASSNFSLQGDVQLASVTIRVPASAYQDVLGQLRALGVKVDSESSNASDVTQEYSDLSASLRTLQATESQLIQLLGRAQNVGEVLQVQDRLNAVDGQIEQVKGRMALLDKLTDLATINVQLRPLAVPTKAQGHESYLQRKVDEAWDSSIDFLESIAGGVLTVIVFGWWLPLVGLPAAAVALRWLRSRPPAADVVD